MPTPSRERPPGPASGADPVRGAGSPGGVPGDVPGPRLIVIDGPAGAGKSTVARRVAAHYGLPVLDTGAIYRALALRARGAGVSWEDGPALAAQARAMQIAFGGDPDGTQRVDCDGEDVTARIRTPDISDGASRVSVHPQVRDALLDLQRALGARGCVAEGRDMGTVVFPAAPHKFFLTADLTTRARRRLAELERRGLAERTLDEVEQEVRERDARDASRASAPLVRAEDAVLVDTSGIDVDRVVAAIIEAVERAREPARG